MERHLLMFGVAIVILICGCQRGEVSGNAPMSPIAMSDSFHSGPEHAQNLDRSDLPSFEVSPAATAEISKIKTENSLGADVYLFCSVHWPKGLCSPQHKMGFDNKPIDSNNFVFQSAGLKVVVPVEQIEMFRDATLTYGHKNGNDGFIFDHPQFQGESLKKWEAILQAD